MELLVINTFKRHDSPVRWIRLLISLGQPTPPPPLGVIYGVYNFVVWWKIQYVFVSLCCSYLIYKCYSTNLKYQRINLINSNIHGHSAMFFRVFTTCILHFFFLKVFSIWYKTNDLDIFRQSTDFHKANLWINIRNIIIWTTHKGWYVRVTISAVQFH